MLEEIIKNVWELHITLKRSFYDSDRPEIIVFVTDDVYYEMKKSIAGEVSSSVYEFYREDKIMGYNVFVARNLNGAPYILHVDHDKILKRLLSC